ncbi:MAG: hypothetical protein M0036_21355 [Desulfobacteraceae bacterium]|nr:hypothetical protein [Desulfobacteraceae bacterium]
MAEKIPINGLKQSEQLSAFWVQPGHLPDPTMPKLCRALAAEQINIAFLNHSTIGAPAPGLCCIDANDRAKAIAIIRSDHELSQSVQVGEQGVGLLSLYPHQASLRVLGTALETLNNRGIMVYGLGSSIAALTFVIDYARMEEAAESLSQQLKLPPDATPSAVDFKVRQASPST